MSAAATSTRLSGDRRPVVACVKWVDLNPGSEPHTGVPVRSRHGWGFSEADHSALEVALRIAESEGTTAVVVSAAPFEAADALGSLAAAGASRSIVVPHGSASGPQPEPAATASVLAGVVGPEGLDAAAVVCGVHSIDRGSGAVPALLAHHLGRAQALGLLAVDVPGSGVPAATLCGVRRLDGGRRERLEFPRDSVISVEGGVARLRRAGLAEQLGTTSATEVIEGPASAGTPRPEMLLPWKPPPRAVPAPAGADAFTRIVDLTGAMEERTPPAVAELDPPEAARRILDQLREWGYRRDVDTEQR